LVPPERGSVALPWEWARADERHGGRIALERYDLVIVGGGAAGINALKAAVTLTARVALVDRGPLGGTCVNWG
jgi:glycerol-3-phosphate dehydrogenase